MNAMTDTARPEAALMQGTALVPPGQREAHYAQIVASHDAEKVRERRRDRGRFWLIAGLAASNLALAGALAVAVPLQRIVPVFVTLNSDGTFNTSITTRDLGTSERHAVIKSTLWLYVAAHERYSSAGHRDDQRTIYMLSDKATGDAYEARVTQRNPEAPWRRYGTRTTVRVERISEGFTCAYASCAGREPDAYVVRFRRITQTEGQRETRVQVEARIRFRQVESIPAWQRVTLNPLGLQVVEYTITSEGTDQ